MISNENQTELKGKMTNQYSIEIHKYISEKISVVEDQIKQAKELNDPERLRFLEGQLSEFFKFREYMHEAIDLQTQEYY